MVAREKSSSLSITTGGLQKFGVYVCPTCAGVLTFQPANPAANALDDGTLVCPSRHSFGVEGGVPRFVEEEGYSESFGFQWKIHHRSQLDSETGTTLTRDRFYKGTGWPENMAGERILEVGCGSGRFTEILLATGAQVFSFDYSRSAEVTHEKFGALGARVCQASVYEMPYTKNGFDRVFCYGVLQHTPDVRTSFFKLVEMVRPGGYLACDVYDRRKLFLNARYRVRWYTHKMDKQRLYNWCKRVVPAYMRLFPPLHPWNQLLFPIKDYRGAHAGLTRAQEVEWSILDTFDALSPAFDTPQSIHTMRRWCEEAGLTDIHLQYGGNGIEVRARKPA